MFFSNLIKKGFGFVREMILAFFFGSSIVYANYLLLKTIADFFSQFTFGNALQANLMPKFTKLYSSNSAVNLENVFLFTKKISLKLFILSQCIQLPLIWYVDIENKLVFVIVSFILGLLVSINFLNSIFLTIFQAKGEFQKHSFATTLNVSLSTLLLYPLVLMFNLIGVVISRLIGVITLSLKYIRPLLSQKGEIQANLSLRDFNFNVLVLGNFANILILIGRFLAGIDGSNEIAFFSYSIIILNTVLTAVIMNINTLVLKIISISGSIKLTLISTGLSLLIGLGLVLFVDLFSVDIIAFVYEREGGAFNLSDTRNTAFFLKELSWSFIFIFMATSLFQPFFTLDSAILRKNAKLFIVYLVVALISIGVFLFVQSYSHKTNIIIVMQFLSVVYFLLSLLSFNKYRRHVA
ncbi:MAG: hypothetical protein VX762_02235 [Bacteroidota bacterium]|nr:hypothetical protein [Bacteroidota bacterium]